MLPASAGDCFFSRRSVDGIFQSGSSTETRAVGSLGGSGAGALVGTLWNLPRAMTGWAGSLGPRPELTLISS